MSRWICATSYSGTERQMMANNNNEKRGPDNADRGSDDGIGMDAEARAYLIELRADEDAARDDWADDGECVEGESGGDPMFDLPEMEMQIILNNIYDM